MLWGKRIDVYDSRDNWKRTDDGWEETIGGPHETVMSYPYEIAWQNQTDISYDGMGLQDVRRMQTHIDNEAMS